MDIVKQPISANNVSSDIAKQPISANNFSSAIAKQPISANQIRSQYLLQNDTVCVELLTLKMLFKS